MVLRVNSQLTPQDSKDKVRKDCYGRGYAVNLKAGTRYVIDLKSTAFDAFLRLKDDKGKVLAENDDIEPGVITNSRILFTATKDGTYQLVASAFEGRGMGVYTLLIREFRVQKKE